MTKDDYGNYTCRAKNSAGEDEAKTLINVLIRPRIYELWNITRPEHEEAELICKATGRPPPEITFRFVNKQKKIFNFCTDQTSTLIEL